MVDLNSDEGLPPGWTVEVKLRKNGKRSDKYYISPSSGLKFNSKVEVFRHLDNANKVSIQRISDNVVVEKRPAEGFPPGWIKKTRITNKGDTIRRDPFYIDPVSGYTFRSIKDVDRYLESGKIGRNAFKSKDKDKTVKVLKDDEFSVRMHKKEINLPCRSSKRLAGIKVDDSVPELKKRNHARQSSVKKPGEEETINTNTDKSTNSLSNCPAKQFNALEVDDPVPEPKTRNQAHRSPVKQPGEEETIITNTGKSTNSLPNCPTKQLNALEHGSEIKCKSDSIKITIELPKLITPEKHPVKNLEVHRSDKDKECFPSLSVPENGDKADTKLEYNPDFPLKEILSDPCIAFAIQTLTGETLETFKDPQISSELRNSQHSETTAAAAEKHGKKINVPREDLERCNVIPSPQNFAIPQEHAGVAKIDHKTNENAGSSSENTLHTSWMDPCIEFAIKTLSGTIPIDCGQNSNNCIQQQLSSSNTQRPMFKQTFVDPTLQPTRNVGIGNSAGARVPHCGGKRRNVG